MNRIMFVLFVAFAAGGFTGCKQRELIETKAKLASVNAELAVMKSELAATKSELAATQADLVEVRAELAGLKAVFAAATHEREIDIKLPEVDAAQPLTQPADLVIDITEGGKYQVQGESLDEQQLLELLEHIQQQETGRGLLIRAAAELELIHVVQVMDMCNRLGIHKYSLAAIENE